MQLSKKGMLGNKPIIYTRTDFEKKKAITLIFSRYFAAFYRTVPGTANRLSFSCVLPFYEVPSILFPIAALHKHSSQIFYQ